MFTIGDFARPGRVSVRMLRHYDAVGLLRPARVDPATGYRTYRADQLGRLNRIITLKELGFTLNQVAAILDDDIDAGQLRGMLRLRRTELAAALAADEARLRAVEARINAIDDSGAVPREEVVVNRIPAVRLAALSAPAAGYATADITPVVVPLFDRLCAAVARAGTAVTGPGTAWYTPTDAGVLVHAGFACAAVVPGTEDVTLPAVTAATAVHHGDMDDSDRTVQLLAAWIEAHGRVSGGCAREVTPVAPADRADWVTELQEPIAD